MVATCGDVSTLEALAATDMLRELGIKVRFVNVVDLLKIQNVCENDQAISDERWTELFGCGDKPVLFAFHAYAGTIHRLIWNRPATTLPASTATRRKAPRQRRSTCCA